MTRVTGIESMVAAAARDAERGEFARYEVPHYVAYAEPNARRGFRLTLSHYGTPILHVLQDDAGERSSYIDRAWWGSRTDMSAISKAHRALGMRRSIKRGELVAY